tara:strand:+ start:1865 stop:2158 length:294 start_codon:yes stop_codon:yes gene_type:complete
MEKNSPMGVAKTLTTKQMDRLKEHAKAHKGGMRGKHMRNMVKFMKAGDTFSTAHTKAMKLDKDNSKPKNNKNGLTEKQKKNLPPKLQEAIRKKKMSK